MPREYAIRPWERVVIVGASTLIVLIGVTMTWLYLGPRSVVSTFVYCFLPTSWVFSVKRVLPIRLPARYYNLRDWETNRQSYEQLGIRQFQRLLQTRFLRMLNRDIQRRFQQRNYREAEQEMLFAETSHVFAFLFALLLALYTLAQGWWDAVIYLTTWNVVVNLYPILLQRYNRGRLLRMMARKRSVQMTSMLSAVHGEIDKMSSAQ